MTEESDRFIQDSYQEILKLLAATVIFDSELLFRSVLEQQEEQKGQHHIQPIASTTRCIAPKELAKRVINLVRFPIQQPNGTQVEVPLEQMAREGHLKNFVFGCRNLCTSDTVSCQVYYEPRQPQPTNTKEA